MAGTFSTRDRHSQSQGCKDQQDVGRERKALPTLSSVRQNILMAGMKKLRKLLLKRQAQHDLWLSGHEEYGGNLREGVLKL